MTELGVIGKIVISEELKKHIDFLHYHIGRTEWSGILFYKHVSGDVSKLKDLVFEAVNLYLMDIGTAGGTSFEYNEDVVDAYEKIEEAIECGSGLIHTHHGMGAFHSGTDWAELKDNADKYNYYISLVVDFQETYKCKIVFPSKSEAIYTNYILDTDGKKHKVGTTKGEEVVLIAGDLEVEIPQIPKTIPTWVENRYTEIKNKPKSFVYTGGFNNTTGFNREGFQSKQNHPRTFTEEDYWNRQIPTNNKIIPKNSSSSTKSTQVETFARALLTLEKDSEVALKIAMNNLETMTEEDEDVFLGAVELNFEKFHDEIYGSTLGFRRHLKDVIKELGKYNPKEKGQHLIEMLGDYVEIYSYES